MRTELQEYDVILQHEPQDLQAEGTEFDNRLWIVVKEPDYQGGGDHLECSFPDGVGRASLPFVTDTDHEILGNISGFVEQMGVIQLRKDNEFIAYVKEQVRAEERAKLDESGGKS